MRKLLGVFVLMLFAAAAMWAQDIQTGYAVVTPSNGASATGLVVFETFGLLLRGSLTGTTQAGVPTPNLTTSAILFVQSSGRLARNLGVAIVNPNATSVDVRMTLRDSAGTELVSETITIGPRQQISQFATDLFAQRSSIPVEFTGTLTLVSEGASPLPISVIGLRFRGINFSTVPVSNLSSPAPAVPVMATGVGGPGAVLVPHFASGGGWATEIVIANNGNTSLTVRVDLFKPDGTPLSSGLNGQVASSFTSLTVPARGVLVLAPRNAQGDDDF